MRGPFDPHIGRTTSIVVLKEFSYGRHALVTSISARSSTEVFFVDPYSGRLMQPAKEDEATFSDESEALKRLQFMGYNILARGSALLGFAVVGSTAGVLLATKLKDKANLPGGHVVHLVQESQWILITLEQESTALPGLPPPEQEFWKSVLQHPVQGSHFFCETVDLTTPFPSSRSIDDPVPEFVWNAWLSQPLKDLGFIRHCPVLLQGAVEAADETHATGERYAMALISRRSRRHPGTRYLARGLNDLAGPGNEIEQDLIFWTPRAGGTLESWAAEGGVVRWARVSWRRGTVPIWWGVDIKNGIQAEVYVREREPYKGMYTYFKNVQQQYESEVGQVDVPVCCVNLLHLHPRKAGEQTLQMHFEEGMSHLRRISSNLSITLNKFDWHDMSRLSEETCIAAFWKFMEPHIKAVGMAVGEMQRSPPSASTASLENLDKPTASGSQAAEGASTSNSNSSRPSVVALTPWGQGWQMAWFQKQRGVLRFNCADSLDRTNAASCFAMLPVMQECLRTLGIQLDITKDSIYQSRVSPLGTAMRFATTTASGQSLSEQSGGGEASDAVQQLPEGWERRETSTGKVFYIDHNTKTTSWDPPPSVPPSRSSSQASLAKSEIAAAAGATAAAYNPNDPHAWEFFKTFANKHDNRAAADIIQEVRDRLFPDAVEDYIDMFKRHGDVHASLYTGSSAMHSHVLSLVLPSASKTSQLASGGVGKLQNLRVAVQRRWNNTYSDSSRQQAMELFLGLNLHVHCPEAETPYPPWLDLSGVLPEDIGIPGEAVHQISKELQGLRLTHHNGKVGVTEPVEDLETLSDEEAAALHRMQARATQPLPAEEEAGLAASAAGIAPGNDSSNFEKLVNKDDEVDDETAFDPLGAVKTPEADKTRPKTDVDLLGLNSEPEISGGSQNNVKDLLL